MLGGIPPFAGEIAGFLAACVTCAVQDAIKATAPIAAVARSVTSRLTRSSCAPEGCLRKIAGQPGHWSKGHPAQKRSPHRDVST